MVATAKNRVLVPFSNFDSWITNQVFGVLVMVHAMDIDEIRHSGRIQLLIFSAALIASSAATAVTIANPGSSRIWVGGFAIAAYSAYRLVRIYFLLFRLRPIHGPSVIEKLDLGLIAVAIGLTMFVATTLLPEYLRVYLPRIGTCWAVSPDDTEFLEPIACWSGDAVFKTVDQVSNPDQCTSDDYLDIPMSTGEIACIEDI